MEIETALAEIAERLRRWRVDQGLTLQQLGMRSAVAPSTIQKIEHRQMVPTLAVMLKILGGLGRSAAELVDGTSGDSEVVLRRAGADADGADPLRTRLGGALDRRTLSAWRVRHLPGHGADLGAAGVEGELLVLCESGRLDVTVGTRVFALGPGDSLHGKARAGVSWRAVGAGPAGLLVVGSDPAGLDGALRRRVKPVAVSRAGSSSAHA